MDLTDFNSAKTLQDTINGIAAVQAKNATTGAKVAISVADEKGNSLVTPAQLKEVLGAAYDTLCGTTLTSLNTALTTAKTTAQTSFDALGV